MICAIDKDDERKPKLALLEPFAGTCDKVQYDKDPAADQHQLYLVVELEASSTTLTETKNLQESQPFLLVYLLLFRSFEKFFCRVHQSFVIPGAVLFLR
jgi:hypothetical protein